MNNNPTPNKKKEKELVSQTRNRTRALQSHKTSALPTELRLNCVIRRRKELNILVALFLKPLSGENTRKKTFCAKNMDSRHSLMSSRGQTTYTYKK